MVRRTTSKLVGNEVSSGVVRCTYCVGDNAVDSELAVESQLMSEAWEASNALGMQATELSEFSANISGRNCGAIERPEVFFACRMERWPQFYVNQFPRFPRALSIQRGHSAEDTTCCA